MSMAIKLKSHLLTFESRQKVSTRQSQCANRKDTGPTINNKKHNENLSAAKRRRNRKTMAMAIDAGRQINSKIWMWKKCQGRAPKLRPLALPTPSDKMLGGGVRILSIPREGGLAQRRSAGPLEVSWGLASLSRGLRDRGRGHPFGEARGPAQLSAGRQLCCCPCRTPSTWRISRPIQTFVSDSLIKTQGSDFFLNR